MFNDLTPAEALEYCQFKRSYDDIALRDLAWLLRDEPELLTRLDFSIETIDLLWQWAVRFVDAGIPGVPDSAVSLEQIVLEHMKGPGAVPSHRVKYDDRREFFDDMLEAYERTTILNYYPEAEYRPLGCKAGSAYRHEPFLFLGRKSYLCMGRSRSIDRDPPHVWRRSNLMSSRIVEGFPEIASRSRQRPAARLIDPAAGVRTAWDDPRRTPPLFAPRADAPIDAAPSRSSFAPRPLFIAIVPTGTGDQDDPRHPMPAEPFVAVLDRLGFRSQDGGRPSVDALTESENEFLDPTGESIAVQTEGREGELVDVLLQPLDATRAQWRELVREMRRAAKVVGARVAEEEDWDV